MNTLAARYNAFISRLDEQPPCLLLVAVARTSLALGTLITLLFSRPAVLFDESVYGYTNLNTNYEYLNIFKYFGFSGIVYYYACCIIILLVVIAGYYPRFTGVLHWLVAFSIFRSATILEGGDQIAVILTLLLIPLTLCDSRKNHWQLSPSTDKHYFIANLSWMLIRLQMALVYYQAGAEKIYKLEEWRNGTAIYYFFNDPIFGYSDWLAPWLHRLLLNGYVVSAFTWGTVLFEIVLFGAYFMRKRRRANLLIAALAFHFGIALLLGLVSFFFAMAGGLILYLSSSKTEKLLGRWLGAGLRRRTTAPLTAEVLA